jgi:hypothetical protein
MGVQSEIAAGQSNTIRCRNHTDTEGNPQGGYALGPGMAVVFQDGPRGFDGNGQLNPANGAFVEDLLVAARQRLEFFQGTKYQHHANAQAIELIDQAVAELAIRANARLARGVLGQNVV